MYTIIDLETTGGKFNEESIIEVAANADAVSVHLAMKSGTKHLLCNNFFDKMKDGEIFVNTSRGEIIDTVCLLKVIEKKSIRVGLDVFENEPKSSFVYFEQTDLASAITCTP